MPIHFDRLPAPPLPHVFCVMPTTAKRTWCIARSIRCWLAQDYLNRSLLVLSDGPYVDDIFALIPDDPRIRAVHLPGERTLGQKYNEGCERAPDGSLIALWADDDWHHPSRLSEVTSAMLAEDVEVGGTMSMLCWHAGAGELYLYHHPYSVSPAEGGMVAWATPYLLGGTMIFSRRLWATSPFPDLQSGSDTVFIRTLLTLGAPPETELDVRSEQDDLSMKVTVAVGDRFISFVQLSTPHLYVAFVGHDNTGNNRELHESRVWSRVAAADLHGGLEPRDYLEKKLGADADAFLGARP